MKQTIPSLKTLLLFSLILLAALRPLIAESYDSVPPALTQALQEVTDPSPVRTIIIDFVILVAFGAWLILQWSHPDSAYRWTGLELGTLVITAAACLSCCCASNKRLAINASLDWICLPVFAMALVQLLDRPWRRRILLSALLASAVAQAVQCFDQYWVGFPETWDHYSSIKSTFWAEQGIALDSAHVELFESRMKAREATGFLIHGNVTGSYLVLCGLAAFAAAMDRRRQAESGTDRWLAVGSYLLALFLFAAAWLTGSRGAWLAALIGAGLWLLRTRMAFWIENHRRAAYRWGWTLVLMGLLATVAYGWSAGTLPGVSLGFRWQYWTASAHLIADHGLTGVGRENFGRSYLQYKSLESPEEITNPHNLFVHAVSEWGWLGLLGVILMLAGASRALILNGHAPCFAPRRSRDARAVKVTLSRPQDSIAAPRVAICTAALGMGLALVRLPLLESANPSFLYVATVLTVIPWMAAFTCFAVGREPQCDRVPRSYTGTAAACALFGFLLHEMINFGLFVPGCAITFFAWLAYALSERTSITQDAPSNKHVGLAAVSFSALTLLAFWLMAVPAFRASHHLRQARSAALDPRATTIEEQPADRHFAAAAKADPLDPAPHQLRAEWLLAQTGQPKRWEEVSNQALRSLEEAAKRDPRNIQLFRHRLRVYLFRAGHSASVQDYNGALAAAEKVVELYPLDPPGLVELAHCQRTAGLGLESAELLRKAADTYRRAVQLDDARPWWERIRRLRENERSAIESAIQESLRLAESFSQKPRPD